jgi:SAM-dependent methyltransferase
VSRSEGIPFPPSELMERVVPLDSDLEPEVEYARTGREIKESIVRALPDDWTFEGKRVLDFGCGAGRVLRHFLPEAERAEFWGSDIDERSVRWAQENLSPPFRIVLNGERPPIRAPQSHFDLIYAMSVFTHITEEWSTWLAELHGLLADDGLLLATFLGEKMIGPLLGERWDENRIGINFAACGTSWDEGGPLTFISPWWLRAHWGRAFEILRLEPAIWDTGDRRGVHGIALLRRRPVEITPEELERPEPGERRELHAAQHNVRQLVRELTRVRGQLYAMSEANRHATETLERVERHWRKTAEWWEDQADAVLESRSWRLMEPLRRLRNRFRANG